MAVSEDLLQKVAPYKRTTWMPVVRDSEKQVSLNSKIGGLAYLPAEEEHPYCPFCQLPLTLFLQLNPQQLPDAHDLDLPPDQLIQLFYCTNRQAGCELKAEAWLPYARSEKARLVAIPADAPEFSELPDSIRERQYDEKRITNWVEAEEYPDWHEMQLGQAGLSEEDVQQLEADERTIPKAGDKLGGWPYWIQAVEYPHCPECQLQMQMIFQLDSNLNLPYMFGDSGIAHLHQCRLHKHQLAFSWAGY